MLSRFLRGQSKFYAFDIKVVCIVIPSALTQECLCLCWRIHFEVCFIDLWQEKIILSVYNLALRTHTVLNASSFLNHWRIDVSKEFGVSKLLEHFLKFKGIFCVHPQHLGYRLLRQGLLPLHMMLWMSTVKPLCIDRIIFTNTCWVIRPSKRASSMQSVSPHLLFLAYIIHPFQLA